MPLCLPLMSYSVSCNLVKNSWLLKKLGPNANFFVAGGHWHASQKGNFGTLDVPCFYDAQMFPFGIHFRAQWVGVWPFYSNFFPSNHRQLHFLKMTNDLVGQSTMFGNVFCIAKLYKTVHGNVTRNTPFSMHTQHNLKIRKCFVFEFLCVWIVQSFCMVETKRFWIFFWNCTDFKMVPVSCEIYRKFLSENVSFCWIMPYELAFLRRTGMAREKHCCFKFLLHRFSLQSSIFEFLAITRKISFLCLVETTNSA